MPLKQMFHWEPVDQANTTDVTIRAVENMLAIYIPFNK